MMQFNTYLITTTVLMMLTACSTSSVQTKRLNTVEELILQTEHDLTNSSGSSNKIKAQEKLGTAKAYLATLKDYQKSLTTKELARYKDLTKKSEELSKQVSM